MTRREFIRAARALAERSASRVARELRLSQEWVNGAVVAAERHAATQYDAFGPAAAGEYCESCGNDAAILAEGCCPCCVVRQYVELEIYAG